MRPRTLLSAATSALVAAIAGTGCLPACAAAEQSIKLSAALTPDRLGHRTSLKIGFAIAAPAGQVPSPVTQVNVQYPSNVGVALSGLGVETCTTAILQAQGPSGCPVDSVMGLGTAEGEIQIGPEIIQASAVITILRAQDQEGHVAMLFNVFAATPVQTEFVIPGVLLPGPAPYGGHIHLNVPLVPSLPEAPDVAAIKIAATIGPEDGVKYTERVHGRTIHYTPKGIPLPHKCPRGGFPFAATFGFQDGSTASAQTHVPCPRRRRRHTS
jgi:hypothetical protein